MAPTDGASEDLSEPPQGLFQGGLGEGIAAKLSPFQLGRDLATTGGRLHCWSLSVGKCSHDALGKLVFCWQKQPAARPRRWALVNWEVPMDLQCHHSKNFSVGHQLGKANTPVKALIFTKSQKQSFSLAFA